MNRNQKQMIATSIREGRLAKGLTQKELSELSNISVRSIQRIENEEIIPRNYTIKALASTLDIPFESFLKDEVQEEQGSSLLKLSNGQKIVLSIGTSLMIVLLAVAFLAQSSKFPETHFELFNFSFVIVAIITGVLLLIWKK